MRNPFRYFNSSPEVIRLAVIEASVPEILWHVLCDIEDILHEHVGDGPRFLADVAASRYEFRGEVKVAASMRGEVDRIMRDHGKK